MPTAKSGRSTGAQAESAKFDARGRADEPASCSNAIPKSEHAGTAGRVSLTVLIPAEPLVELGFAKRPRLFVRELLATGAFGRCGCGAENRKQHRSGQWNKNARHLGREHINLLGLRFDHHN